MVSQTDAGGGAGLAAGRLHRGLRQAGFDSHMLVSSVSSHSDEFTSTLPLARGSIRIGKRILGQVLPRLGLRNLAAVESFGWVRHPMFTATDVVNFHNLHGEFFSYLALPRLTALRPAVLTLHDMWAFTGHCIYSYDCERWNSGCGACPYPDTYPEIRRDATHQEWRLKRRAFQKSRITIIAISRWMERQVRQSFLQDCSIRLIPNGIDLAIYRPLDRVECRRFLGLPVERNLILFAAADLEDRRKGGDLLLEALRGLSPILKSKTSLVIMGTAAQLADYNLGMEVFPLGYVHDDRLKAQIFSAADVFAFPTRADNLPLVLQESMACGTPLVSFDVGGVSDLVRPGLTGLLAAPEDAANFLRHLETLLSDNALRSSLSHSCRIVAEQEYNVLLQARRYGDVFSGLLNANS